MKNNRLQTIEGMHLDTRLQAVDAEFKDFLADILYKREFGPDKLKTFSPLDAVADFAQKGILSVKEVSRDEMLGNNNAFNKLLANMLAECKPGALSDDDLNQITGINGREIHAGL
ncbi:MAG: hypothetical protein HQM16_00860 [Deltaproteobacteria bacterium]|nr:hypothetical protein [Deltaproteobacteria bacterium]